MSSINLSIDEQQTCLQVAKQSIAHGLTHGSILSVDLEKFTKALQQQGASFVTLHKKGQLRGCIGTLEARQPLVRDIVEHAFQAAFRDPRFPAVDKNEIEQLEIEISILGKPETIDFKDEVDLLSKLRPGIDGLILEYGSNRSTFLPTVWEQLPKAEDFIQHLKIKAGLSKDWWNNEAKISRYETFSFS